MSDLLVQNTEIAPKLKSREVAEYMLYNPTHPNRCSGRSKDKQQVFLSDRYS